MTILNTIKVPFIVVSLLFIGLLIFGTTAFLDLFNIAKEFFNPIKE